MNRKAVLSRGVWGGFPALKILLMTVVFSVILVWGRALPSGWSVRHGKIMVRREGREMSIEQLSRRAIVNWRDFSIGRDHSVRVVQRSSLGRAIMLARVIGQEPSRILGRLQADQSLYLVNPHGIFFGPHARVDVGAMFATSTLALSDEDFLRGRDVFQGDSGAAIINEGAIEALSAALLGRKVVNRGTVTAKGQLAMLGGAREIELCNFGENARLTFKFGAPGPATSVTNQGVLDTGYHQGDVTLYAHGGAASNAGGTIVSGAVEVSGDAVQLHDLGHIKATSLLLDPQGTLRVVQGEIDDQPWWWNGADEWQQSWYKEGWMQVSGQHSTSAAGSSLYEISERTLAEQLKNAPQTITLGYDSFELADQATILGQGRDLILRTNGQLRSHSIQVGRQVRYLGGGDITLEAGEVRGGELFSGGGMTLIAHEGDIATHAEALRTINLKAGRGKLGVNQEERISLKAPEVRASWGTQAYITAQTERMVCSQGETWRHDLDLKSEQGNLILETGTFGTGRLTVDAGAGNLKLLQKSTLDQRLGSVKLTASSIQIPQKLYAEDMLMVADHDAVLQSVDVQRALVLCSGQRTTVTGELQAGGKLDLTNADMVLASPEAILRAASIHLGKLQGKQVTICSDEGISLYGNVDLGEGCLQVLTAPEEFVSVKNSLTLVAREVSFPNLMLAEDACLNVPDVDVQLRGTIKAGRGAALSAHTGNLNLNFLQEDARVNQMMTAQENVTIQARKRLRLGPEATLQAGTHTQIGTITLLADGDLSLDAGCSLGRHSNADIVLKGKSIDSQTDLKGRRVTLQASGNIATQTMSADLVDIVSTDGNVHVEGALISTGAGQPIGGRLVGTYVSGKHVRVDRLQTAGNLFLKASGDAPDIQPVDVSSWHIGGSMELEALGELDVRNLGDVRPGSSLRGRKVVIQADSMMDTDVLAQEDIIIQAGRLEGGCLMADRLRLESCGAERLQIGRENAIQVRGAREVSISHAGMVRLDLKHDQETNLVLQDVEGAIQVRQKGAGDLTVAGLDGDLNLAAISSGGRLRLAATGAIRNGRLDGEPNVIAPQVWLEASEDIGGDQPLVLDAHEFSAKAEQGIQLKHIHPYHAIIHELKTEQKNLVVSCIGAGIILRGPIMAPQGQVTLNVRGDVVQQEGICQLLAGKILRLTAGENMELASLTADQIRLEAAGNVTAIGRQTQLTAKTVEIRAGKGIGCLTFAEGGVPDAGEMLKIAAAERIHLETTGDNAHVAVDILETPDCQVDAMTRGNDSYIWLRHEAKGKLNLNRVIAMDGDVMVKAEKADIIARYVRALDDGEVNEYENDAHSVSIHGASIQAVDVKADFNAWLESSGTTAVTSVMAGHDVTVISGDDIRVLEAARNHLEAGQNVLIVAGGQIGNLEDQIPLDVSVGGELHVEAMPGNDNQGAGDQEDWAAMTGTTGDGNTLHYDGYPENPPGVIRWNGSIWGKENKTTRETCRKDWTWWKDSRKQANRLQTVLWQQKLYFPHVRFMFDQKPPNHGVEHILCGYGEILGLPEGVGPDRIDMQELSRPFCLNDHIKTTRE